MQRSLLVVSEYFWPDEASTGKLLGELFEVLARDPHLQITVLTSNRLYRSSRSQSLEGRENWGPIKIVRLPSRRTGNVRFLKRLLSDLVFAAQATLFALRHSYDCLFVVTNPPLMPLFIAQVNAWKRKPLLYLIHDLYPDLPVALRLWNPDSLVVKFLRRWQRRSFGLAERVIVLGRCMRDYLYQQYGVPGDSVAVIPNWFSIPYEEPALTPTDEFRIVYSGNLGQFQDFDTLLDAAALLQWNDKIRFYICGDGHRKEYIRQRVAAESLGNVVVQEFLSGPEFAALLRTASLGVVTLEPQMEGLGVPSKTYNLLAMGVPVAAILGFQSEVARVVEEVGCGIRVGHGDSKGLADRILELQGQPDMLRSMSDRGRTYAQAHSSLNAVARMYREMIYKVMGATDRDGA